MSIDPLASAFEPFIGARHALSFAPHDRYLVRLIEVQSGLDRSLLLKTLNHVFYLHDLLRLRAFQHQSDLELFITDHYLDEPVEWINLASLSDEEQRDTIRSTAIRIYNSLENYQGHFSRFVYFDRGELHSGFFLIVLHHVIADDYSLNMLMQNIRYIYLQLQRDTMSILPEKTTSFNQFIMRIKKYLHTDFRQELDYWSSLVSKTCSLPVDYPREENNLVTQAEPVQGTKAQRFSLSLDVEKTGQLMQLIAKLKISLEDILIAGLLHAVKPWLGSPSLSICIMKNGRSLFDDISIVNTLGHISTGFWNSFDIQNTASPKALLSATLEQRQRIPNQGMGLGLAMNYAGYNDPAWLEFFASEKMGVVKTVFLSNNILMNYLGNFTRKVSPSSSSFRMAEAPYQDLVNPYELLRGNLHHVHQMGLRVVIQDGALFIFWEYDGHLYRRETIETLADNHLQAVQAILSARRSW